MAMEQISIGLSIALNRLLSCEGARKLVETDDVVAIEEESNGNEAVSRYDESHVPSVRVDQTL